MVNEVLALLGEISGRAVRVRPRGAPVLGDVLRTGGSTEALSKATGWMPRVGLRRGSRSSTGGPPESRSVTERSVADRAGGEPAPVLTVRTRSAAASWSG